MNLVLLTFGDRIENHYQAVFSILSFLKDSNISQVIIITDRADFYSILDNYNIDKKRVEIILIDNPTLSNWKGKHNFFWRIKIKALEMVTEKYPNQNILYVDSDTVLTNSLTPIVNGLNEQQPFMHLKEELLSEGKSKTVQKMWKSLQGKTFANITINKYSAMWNAGVIGLPANIAKEIINLSLQICDEICATDCPRRLVEQFSLSIALNYFKDLKSCENIIAHYWGNKHEWNKVISDFLLYALLNQQSLDQILLSFDKIDLKKIPIIKKESNTVIRLRKLIDKIFKPKQIEYLN